MTPTARGLVAPVAAAAVTALVATVLSVPVPAQADGSHDHGDTTTKNLVSRSGEDSAAAQDPTTPAEARRGADVVARQRLLPDPPLRTVPTARPRAAVPQDRYAMAGGCYTLVEGGEAFRFRAVDLGVYLIMDGERSLLAADGSRTDEPGPATEWTASHDGRRMTFRSQGSPFRQAGRDRFSMRVADDCPRYAESQVGVSGRPHAGVTSYQEVRGYVDAHTHGMAFEFLGGEVHCGRPWHRYGPAYALVDCEDHTATGGNGAALETLLSGEPSHDPVGWPTFKDWPAPRSLTHEGTYYKWLERSWRGGQRLFVNLLVENNKLCELYPLKRNSCDDMDSLRLQAQRMYELQDYVDAQYGGPGRGWYRIVTSPWQARRVINAGRLAVVMGIETSVPFGCTFKKLPGGDADQCDPAGIDRQLDEMHDLGVRQMELVNKFDNALSGIAGDAGEVGVAVNAANFLETGTFWDMRHCEPADGESADKTQHAAPDIGAGQQDALFGAIADLFATANVGVPPVYGPPLHCNARGLTDLGTHLVDAMADRGMLIDPDHMSVKARDTLLDQLEARRYPGAISSHSWSTPDAYPRIYDLGGYVAPYAGDSTGFVDKWRRHLGWANPRYYFGFGYGADINGLGAQGDPRGADVDNPVTYPFTGFNGVTVRQQHAGRRVYDLNSDGVAQYGLYPDWIQDLTKVAGSDGAAIEDDMMRGAEAYLQTWERAEGIAPDPCRNPDLRLRAPAFRRAVTEGMTTRQVMRAVGQPWQRLGQEFTYCATAEGRRAELEVSLSRGGRVTGVRRSA